MDWLEQKVHEIEIRQARGIATLRAGIAVFVLLFGGLQTYALLEISQIAKNQESISKLYSRVSVLEVKCPPTGMGGR